MNRLKALKKKDERSHSKRGSAALGAGAAILAVAIFAGISLQAKVPVQSEAQAVLKQSYAVEELIDMPPGAEAVLPDNNKEKEKNKAYSAASVISYLAGAALSFFARLLLGLISPVAAQLAAWLFLSAAVLAAVFFALKKLFPGIELKKLLSKKTVLALISATAVIIAACELVGRRYPQFVSHLYISAVLAGAVLAYLVYRKAAASPPSGEAV